MPLPQKLGQAIRNAAAEMTTTTPVTMFFLRRTSSKFDNKKYEVVTVEIEGEVADDLREIFSKRMERLVKDLDEGNLDFKDFLDENIKAKDLSEIDSKAMPPLKYIRQSMKDDGLLRIYDLSKVKDFDAYAVEFHLPSGNAIYFRKIGLAQLITKKFDLAYVLQQGKFNKIEDDVVAFDKQVDAIFFDYSNSLLVLNRFNVEIIFNFKEFYQVHSQAVFLALSERNLIEITDEVLLEALGNYHVTRRVTTLLKDGKFNREIQFFTDHRSYFDANQQHINADEIQLEIQNDRVIINNAEKLETFLNICDDDYVRGVISGIWYVSNLKHKLSRDSQN